MHSSPVRLWAVPGADGVRTAGLGARSILADPRSPTAQRTLNLKGKIPRVLPPVRTLGSAEDVGDWFDLDQDSPYMLLVADVRKTAGANSW